ncbi:MAG: hypothetical protein HQ510_03890 [Candidatus Marinimicrobia bacterium]|nr:hypothetical protein [Candidatus Neomarinimicrobiota bacterium]
MCKWKYLLLLSLGISQSPIEVPYQNTGPFPWSAPISFKVVEGDTVYKVIAKVKNTESRSSLELKGMRVQSIIPSDSSIFVTGEISKKNLLKFRSDSNVIGVEYATGGKVNFNDSATQLINYLTGYISADSCAQLPNSEQDKSTIIPKSSSGKNIPVKTKEKK